jgi:heat shock protein HslJ
LLGKEIVMKLAFSTFLLAAALLIAGCKDWFPPIDPTPPNDPGDTTHHTDTSAALLAGRQWCLVAIENQGGIEPVNLDPSVPSSRYIIFDGAGNLSGDGGYNTFFGNYLAVNGTMQVLNFGGTKRWSDSIETMFFDILRNASGYDVDGSGLRIYSRYEGTLHFEACTVVDTTADTVVVNEPKKVELDQNFDLGVASTAQLNNATTNVFINFVGVTGDSRCPLGTQCVWEGDGTILVDAMVGNQAYEGELHTNKTEGPQVLQMGAYDLTLVELKPYPVGGAVIDPRAYVAVFRISRH